MELETFRCDCRLAIAALQSATSEIQDEWVSPDAPEKYEFAILGGLGLAA